jgi:hypothetical protein
MADRNANVVIDEKVIKSMEIRIETHSPGRAYRVTYRNPTLH